MTPKSRNLGKKGKTVQKSHTGKRYPNLEIFYVKWSLKYLEANGENQFENGVEINSQTQFERKSTFLKKPKIFGFETLTRKWNISWKTSCPCLDKFKYEISSKTELRSTLKFLIYQTLTLPGNSKLYAVNMMKIIDESIILC